MPPPNNLPPLPEGFTLDTQTDLPPLPEGFVPDQRWQAAEPPQTLPVRPGIYGEAALQTGKDIGRQFLLGAQSVGKGILGATGIGPAADALATAMNYGTQAAGGGQPFYTTNQAFAATGLPQPETWQEKTSDIGSQMIAGTAAAAPMARAAMARIGLNPATPAVVPPRQQVLQNAQRQGYVVPPATARPTNVIASVAEGAAGKLSTGQRAAAINQPVTNRLAAQAVGLTDDGMVTREALQQIRQEAGGAHAALRNYGREFVSDTTYRNQVSNAVRSLRSAAKTFPALAQDDIVKIADGLEQPRFDPDDAVTAIQLLRDKATAAYGAKQGTLGKAYRTLSDAFEGLIERRLAEGGDEAKSLLTNFRDARQLIAKTYTLEGALRGQNIDAAALGRALSKGKPLSGTLRTIAQFAQEFPKAARVIPATESLPAYSPLDFLAATSSLGAAAVSGDWKALIPAAYVAGRPLIRNALLSQPVQSALAPGSGVLMNALGRGAVGAAYPAVNAMTEEEQRRLRAIITE